MTTTSIQFDTSNNNCCHFASEDPSILLVPDRNNPNTEPFLDLAFDSIVHFKNYNRIVIVSDITPFLPSEIRENKEQIPVIFAPKNDDSVLSGFTPGVIPQSTQNLEEVELNITENINFELIFGATLERLRAKDDFAGKPLYLLATANIKASHLCDFLRMLLPTRKDLFIFQATLSSGLSEAEARNIDINTLSSVIALDNNIKKSSTRCAPLFKTLAYLGHMLRLRPYLFSYAPIPTRGQRTIAMRGVCSAGYFF